MTSPSPPPLHCMPCLRRAACLPQELTNAWLGTHFPDTFSAVLFGNHYSASGAKRAKSDMCRELGASALVDDSVRCVERPRWGGGGWGVGSEQVGPGACPDLYGVPVRTLGVHSLAGVGLWLALRRYCLDCAFLPVVLLFGNYAWNRTADDTLPLSVKRVADWPAVLKVLM